MTTEVVILVTLLVMQPAQWQLLTNKVALREFISFAIRKRDEVHIPWTQKLVVNLRDLLEIISGIQMLFL